MDNRGQLLVELRHLAELTQKWLVYAEAKLTAFVAIVGLLIYNLVRIFSLGTISQSWMLKVGLGCFVFGFLLALLGLIPKMRYLPMFGTRNDAFDADAVTYFNVFSTYNLSRSSAQKMLYVLSVHVGILDYTPQAIDLDYGELITSTARVIRYKYLFFLYAFLSVIFGIGLILFKVALFRVFF